MFVKVGLIISVFLKIIFVQTAKKPACSIKINKDLDEREPLILRAGKKAGIDAFYLPNEGDTIDFTNNAEIDFVCPSSTVLLKGTTTKSNSARAKCNKKKFKIGKRSLNMWEIHCSKPPENAARYTKKKCLSRYTGIEIGFDLGSRFLAQIFICFDKKHQTPLYSEHTISKHIGGAETAFPRPNWKEDKFYDLQGVKVATLYQRPHQASVINDLLGISHKSRKYIGKANAYLSRGHLTPKADFIYGDQQKLTHYFINAAPQWQSFNAGNWVMLEGCVRKYANQNNLDLKVYTGTYGISTLPDDKGHQKELFLFDEDGIKAVPVPKFFWKIMYDPKSKHALGFVGVNNPYFFDHKKDVICKDISHKYKWLTWKAKNVSVGYSYACDVKELRKTINTIPSFQVHGTFSK